MRKEYLVLEMENMDQIFSDATENAHDALKSLFQTAIESMSPNLPILITSEACGVVRQISAKEELKIFVRANYPGIEI